MSAGRAPDFWLSLLKHIFGVRSEKFAAKIWGQYPVSATLLYALANTEDGAESLSDVEWHASVGRLVRLLDPVALIAASVAIAPENGRPRDRAAVDFEEVVLSRLSHGRWRTA